MRLFAVIVAIGVFVSVAFFVWQNNLDTADFALKPIVQIQEKPLDKYTFENLSKRQFNPSKITLGDLIEENNDFVSRFFFFEDNGKSVSGLINIPTGKGPFPVVVMFRGYVDREIYTTGIGTQRAGEVFARNGFMTVAPDFLGYGESDNPSEDVMEERFQTYTTALTLLSSIENLNRALSENKIDARADSDKVGIWGHSNGGQIALSVLEISESTVPTVLWAPVTKPFPYSILYYTDEFNDRGKMLRQVIARFEEDYNVDNYDLTKFLEKIRAPIQVHQGTQDDAVPQEWSDEFTSEMEKLGKDIEYFTYSGSDHNLVPNGWTLAVGRGIDFYNNFFNQ